MAYAITQTCCTDASCVAVCPVNCIHPAPDEPDFGTTEMLYVDPRTCIDCGACADACPVDAVFPVENLTEPLRDYADLNAVFYTDREPPAVAQPNFHAWGAPTFPHAIPSDFPELDVAVVGSGPAGMYAVEDLVLHTSARVTLIDRLPIPGGLITYGVAPDHPSTKKIGDTFARFRRHPRVRVRLDTEIGRDITAAELAARYDGVIYAVGASSARRLGIPGEDLPGSVAATTVVGWYNGHPDVPAGAIDLSAERIVVVGNGNVALDVARVLTTLARLRSGKVREVVLLGRRGPQDAAYSTPELLALARQHEVDLVVDDHDPRVTKAIDAGTGKAGLLQGLPREAVDWPAPPRHDRQRIVLRFHSAPQEILGDSQVRSVRVAGAEIPAGLVVRAVGYRGSPVPGLPFDEDSGTIPNTAGKVEPGTYVVGWIKRGPSGGIGANRTCARETVGALLDDVVAGRITPRRKR